MIAERTGYRSAKTRLDHLQAAYFRAAVAGDLAAASFVLKVINPRCSILGLDQADEAPERPRAILITGSSEEYVAGLPAIAEATDDEDRAGR